MARKAAAGSEGVPRKLPGPPLNRPQVQRHGRRANARPLSVGLRRSDTPPSMPMRENPPHFRRPPGRLPGRAAVAFMRMPQRSGGVPTRRPMKPPGASVHLSADFGIVLWSPTSRRSRIAPHRGRRLSSTARRDAIGCSRSTASRHTIGVVTPQPRFKEMWRPMASIPADPSARRCRVSRPPDGASAPRSHPLALLRLTGVGPLHPARPGHQGIAHGQALPLPPARPKGRQPGLLPVRRPDAQVVGACAAPLGRRSPPGPRSGCPHAVGSFAGRAGPASRRVASLGQVGINPFPRGCARGPNFRQPRVSGIPAA
jgi:hypothetical protein